MARPIQIGFFMTDLLKTLYAKNVDLLLLLTPSCLNRLNPLKGLSISYVVIKMAKYLMVFTSLDITYISSSNTISGVHKLNLHSCFRLTTFLLPAHEPKS